MFSLGDGEGELFKERIVTGEWRHGRLLRIGARAWYRLRGRRLADVERPEPLTPPA
jgi:hypothetical protein